MQRKAGFTILEMMIVLTVIALVFLLTLPNIQQKQKTIQTQGCKALMEVVNSQVLLYELDHNKTPASIDVLIKEGYLKENQNICQGGKKIVLRNGQAVIQ